jgi:PAS domain-containing protein
MGITSAWSISAHDDAFIGTLAPRLLPLIAAERDEPFARERWDRWRREPLPDFRTWWEPFGRSGWGEADALNSFHELTASGEHVQKMYDGLSPEDDFSLLADVWDLVTGAEEIFLSVQSKEFALRSFFHAIGPDRAALLPGWCGNFLLTSAEVRATLPAVERALGFTPKERAAAENQDWLEYRDDEESVLDGPLRMWRQAAADGRGLCGVSVIVC